MITGLAGNDRGPEEQAKLEAMFSLVRRLERSNFGQSSGEGHDGADLRTVQNDVRAELSGLRPGNED